MLDESCLIVIMDEISFQNSRDCPSAQIEAVE